MELVLRDELRTLIQNTGGPCVSVFMPTHPAGHETRQDPIRFKNLLRKAEEQLITTGMRSPEAQGLLAPARGLLDDGFFWRSQRDGLAVFVSPEFYRNYRLPLHFDELSVVDERFYINPLFPLFTGDRRFFILALSQKGVRMLRCSRYACSEVELTGTPKNIDEALRFDEPQSKQRFHMRVRGTMAGSNEAMFRGHGAGMDDTKTDLLRYLMKISDGIHEVLKEEQAPLVLAAVDYLHPLYREANAYSHLFPEGILGNPDGLSDEELHGQALELIEPLFRRAQEDAMGKYRQFAGTGLASHDLKDILVAAASGRVESLILSRGIQVWGTFDLQNNTVEVHETGQPGDDGLLNIAAIHTFLNRGDIYLVEAEQNPGGGPVAAVYRY